MESRFRFTLTISWVLCALAALHAAPTHEQPHPDMVIPSIGLVDLEQGGRLRVVATTDIVGDVVSHIGGDGILLTVLMEPGQDPHGYEPTPRALVAAEDAHLICINGGGLEESLVSAIFATAKGAVVPVSAGLDDGDDPHYWTDPNNVMVWVRNITEVLSTADPSRRESYESNADRYLEDLTDLDTYIREQIARVPKDRRRLITDHDTLGYYAEAYGLQITGTVLPGNTTTSDSSAARVAELVRVLRDEQVKTIFSAHGAGRSVSGIIDAIGSELAGEVRVIPLLTGSLAPRGHPGDNYIGYMEYNTNQIVAGLLSGQ